VFDGNNDGKRPATNRSWEAKYINTSGLEYAQTRRRGSNQNNTNKWTAARASNQSLAALTISSRLQTLLGTIFTTEI